MPCPYGHTRCEMEEKIKHKTQEKSHAALDHLRMELAGVRTGRASLILFELLSVNAYGTMMPLKQLASMATPESGQVTIQPWDLGLISEIEKAVRSSSMGLSPINDGRIIRVPIPRLTEEKRKELVKVVRQMGETCKVEMRNIRREVNEDLKGLQKVGGFSEDDIKKNQDGAQKMTDQAIAQIGDIVSKKEEDILQV